MDNRCGNTITIPMLSKKAMNIPLRVSLKDVPQTWRHWRRAYNKETPGWEVPLTAAFEKRATSAVKQSRRWDQTQLYQALHKQYRSETSRLQLMSALLYLDARDPMTSRWRDMWLYVRDVYLYEKVRARAQGRLYRAGNPFHVLSVRNELARRLRVYQSKINRVLNEDADTLDPNVFIPWFVLCSQVWSIPMRTQAFQNLMWQSSNQRDVSRLVWHRPYFYRVLAFDKVQDSSYPAPLRWCGVLSFYLWVWMSRVRGWERAGRVFGGAQGGVLDRLPTMVKRFVTDALDFPHATFDRSDLFLHHLRNWTITVYGLQRGFEPERMRHLGNLTRHDYHTMYREYAPYMKWYRAVAALHELRDLDMCGGSNWTQDMHEEYLREWHVEPLTYTGLDVDDPGVSLAWQQTMVREMAHFEPQQLCLWDKSSKS